MKGHDRLSKKKGLTTKQRIKSHNVATGKLKFTKQTFRQIEAKLI